MRPEKILAIVVVLYLAIALPLQFANMLAIEECRQACSLAGFDIILSASGTGNKLSCRCLVSYTREEKTVEI